MNREIVAQAMAAVTTATSTEHPPGHRCLECRVLRVAFSGADDAAYIREGFKKNADGKWEDIEPKEKT